MEVIENTHILGQVVIAAGLLLALFGGTGCVSQMASVGGTESHQIYKELRIELAKIENDTERRRVAK